MTALRPADYVDAARREGAALRAAATAGVLDRPVPTCPGWTLERLVGHLGRVYHAQMANVRRGGTEPPVDKPPKPPAGEAVLDYFDAGLTMCVDTLTNADPAAPAWNFTGANLTAGFWHRRMAQETAVHRVDAQGAAGLPDPIEARLAVDGIDEQLDAFLPMVFRSGPVERLAGTLHLHATDTDGEWYVELSPTGASVQRRHAKADAAVQATASDLYLLLMGRLGPDAATLTVHGDADVLGRWQDAVRI
jgi:uncharacterized protein (TIGR03083 family)